jgi:Fuc2NAc and GlcNAc transferase
VTGAWIVLLVFVVAVFLTGAVRRYALARQLMDVPNARSSHTTATPRGGGVAIVLCFLASVPLLHMQGMLPAGSQWALLGAGGVVALVGFLDDHGHIAARWRLLAHFAAASWALYWLAGAPPVSIFGNPTHLGWLGSALAAIYLVWLLNLYNFMDGIDGIAAVETICTCIGGSLLFLLADEPALSLAPLTLAAAAGGFLCWNFPRAKIFMGDAGSGFLGIVMGILSLSAAWVAPHLLWAWVVLLGVFIVDATITLLRRLVKGEKVYEAHRSHAYQHASRRFHAHLPVTLAVAAINLLWLLPLALLIGVGRLEGLHGVLLAYAPLVALAVKFRAGQPG